MSKWARKARKLGITQAKVSQHTLHHTINEAKGSLESLEFIIGHTSCEGSLSFDVSGLNTLEYFYRSRLFTNERLNEFPDETVERLMGLFLGQILVEHGIGYWATYEGRHYVAYPHVIKLNQPKSTYVDPVSFCDGLRNKSVDGNQSMSSLRLFFENVESRSFT
ncbi:hypothetical protein [Aliikangiella coralliicola]|uniref:Uncharacterized protein n=1 Tax=Aliikangiella coralliicola TaxID=2592383 RepID=A0A545U8M0_9GAMM|nr:hypothetical protein [Aliikangiella coralliicola]TQV85814.1 hypothetical protein FLL46_17975 [Aliikangiella coralliicola]